MPIGSSAGPATKTDLKSQLAAESASAKGLETIRASAAKWQTALTAGLGLFGLSGLVKGPDDIAKVAQVWRWPLPILLGWAVVGGLVAVLLAARAAYGLPAGLPATGADFQRYRRDAAQAADTALYRAIVIAITSYLAFVLAVGILWFAPRATPTATLALVATPGQIICGTLRPAAAGGLEIVDPNTAAVTPVSAREVQAVAVVSACPAP